MKLLIQYRPGKEFAAGWLAGMFDAEGSLSRVLRISSLNERRTRNLNRFAATLGFETVIEKKGIRLRGGITEILRFMTLCRPASQAKRNKMHGMKRLNNAPVTSIEPDGTARVVNMQTTSGTYWAAGFASHNCYYLPTDSFKSVKTWEEQAAEVLAAQSRGCDSADITGGEPLQNPHVAQLVAFADAHGIATRIITSLLCPEKTLDDVLEAGVSDFLVSMHGAKASTHDAIVHVPRARSFQIRRLAKIAARMRYCANYVMIEKNQTEMADWARWLTSLDHEPPKVVNFINFNVFPEWEENGTSIRAQALANVTDLRIAGPILDEAIDILEEAGVGVNVRYMPMCAVAERHRKNITNDLHVAFDQGEWDNAFGARTPVDQVYQNYSVHLSIRNEEKGEPCSGCDHQWICGGANKLWHKFALEKFGTETLVPISLPPDADRKDFWMYRGLNVGGLDPRGPRIHGTAIP